MELSRTLTERSECPYCNAEVAVEFNKYDEGECPRCEEFILAVNGVWETDEDADSDGDNDYTYTYDDDDDDGW